MSNNRNHWSLLGNNGGTPPPPPPGVFFSMTEIPYADPDLLNYGRGAEQWHNPCTNSTGCPSGSGIYDRVSNPSVGSNNQWTENSPNRYIRVQWSQLEGATQDSYDFTVLDNFIRAGIDNKQMISFGIMTFYDDPPDGDVFYDNGMSSYPLYLHNLMQAETANSRDWKTFEELPTTGSGRWVPNWNSTNYITRLRALHTAIKNYLLTTSYNGTLYANAIYCIDIRGYGNYGEWHTGGICDWGDYPTGRQPTIATLKAIIDAHTDIFDQWPLVMMIAAYNATPGGTFIPLFHPYAEVAHYALDATNAWGQVGYRRDQVGSRETYLNQLLELNTAQFPTGTGLTVGQKFLNLYKTAPGTGEPMPFEGIHVDNQMIDVEAQVALYKPTSFGNGNYIGVNSTQNTTNIGNRLRNAFKLCGYRLKITTGEAPVIITRGTPFDIKANWVNVGIAPCYENWTVQYQLQTLAGSPVWTGDSSKVLKLFRPDEGIVLTTDTLTVPVSVPAGTYKLVVKVVDPLGYKNNLLLAMQPMNADRSYTIHASVTLNAT